MRPWNNCCRGLNAAVLAVLFFTGLLFSPECKGLDSMGPVSYAYALEAAEDLASETEEELDIQPVEPVKATRCPNTPDLVRASVTGLKLTLVWEKVPGADGYRIYQKESGGDWEGIKTITSWTSKKGRITYERDNLSPGSYRFTVRAFRLSEGERIYGEYDKRGLSARVTGWDLQTNYPDTPYRNRYGHPYGATISSGGCGAVSVGNILRNYIGIEELTTRKICALATACGARYNGGTDPEVLLAYCQKKYRNFVFYLTYSDATMDRFVANGGMAVAHTTGYYPLFASSGHFVAIKDFKGGKYTVFDQYYEDGKWDWNWVRRHYVEETSEIGRVRVSRYQAHRAFNYYLLIKPASIQKKTQTITKLFSQKKRIVIKWKEASSQCSGYVICRRTGNGPYKRIATIRDSSVLRYFDKDVKNGKRYTYKVCGYNGCLYTKYKERSVVKRKPGSGRRK